MNVREKIKAAREFVDKEHPKPKVGGKSLSSPSNKALAVIIRQLLLFVHSQSIRQQIEIILEEKGPPPGQKIDSSNDAYDYIVSRWTELKEALVIVIEAIENPVALPADKAYPARQQIADFSKVFVVHGRDLQARDGIFRFLRSIHLKPLEWSQVLEETRQANPSIEDVLDAAFGVAGAVVVLLTPDDMAKLRENFLQDSDPPYEKEPTPQARPNVLFEAGMAFGRHPERTVLVQAGKCRPFSDIAGRYVIHWDNSSEKRQELAQALRRAGCPVDLDGTGWHTEGVVEIDSFLLNEGMMAEFDESLRGLSTEGKKLLKMAAAHGRHRGTIMIAETMAGKYAKAGDEVVLREESPPEDTARYVDAIEMLHNGGFLRRENDELFTLTTKAYDAAKKL